LTAKVIRLTNQKSNFILGVGEPGSVICIFRFWTMPA
jgi:hypothetical protein